MAAASNAELLQSFVDEKGKELGRLPTHFDCEAGVRYVLWSDIQDSFADVRYIKDRIGREFFMLDKNHQVGIPRFKYSQFYAYTIVSSLTTTLHSNLVSDPLYLIREDLTEYKALIYLVANHCFRSLDDFRRFAATKDYYRSKLLNALSTINSEDTSIQCGKANALQEVTKLDLLSPSVDEYEKMRDLSEKSYSMFRRQPNRLFLILPTNCDHWDETNIATNTFRLYFMCNNTGTMFWTPNFQPAHVHISDHPGYMLKNPQEFLKRHHAHALAVLLMVKYGFRDSLLHVPGLDTFKVLASASGAASRHNLTSDNIGPLINKAIAYIRAYPQPSQSSGQGNNDSWDVRPFLQLDDGDGDGDNGTGHLCLRHRAPFNCTIYQWICDAHCYPDPKIEELVQFVRAQDGMIDLQNCIISMDLRSKIEVDRLAACNNSKERPFELFVKISWTLSRRELRTICEQLVGAGFCLAHIHGIYEVVDTQYPIEFSCIDGSLIILHDYPRPAETYISLTMSPYGHLGLRLQQRDGVSAVLLEELVQSVVNVVDKAPAGKLHSFLRHVRASLCEHTTLNLSGVNVFHPKSNRWVGLFEVRDGLNYNLVEALIPCDQFNTSVLRCGWLRRLVLMSCSIHDILQVVSLMACSPLLEQIQLPARENTILGRIWMIQQNYRRVTHPLELIFSDLQTIILAKLTIGPRADSKLVHTRSRQPRTPVLSIIEWYLDLVHEPMHESGVRILDKGSRLSPSVLTSFKLDITALTTQSLLIICSILQRSALECLYIHCVPFMPFMEASIVGLLRAIRWPTIKSLVLTGNHIDGWLKLWGSSGYLQSLVGTWIDPSASGPDLVSLSIIAHEENKVSLSHASALVIHHLVYSCRLVELHLENVLLGTKKEWSLVLHGLHYSSLQNVSLQGSNVSDSRRRKVMIGKSITRFKDRVDGWFGKRR